MLNLTRVTSARPSAALVISIVALISSLTGTAFAAGVLPAGSVASKQLRNWAVTTPKIKANAVNSAKVEDGSLRAVDFAAGQLPAGAKGDKGDTGAPGSAVAYAQSTGGSTPTLTATATKGFTAVTRSAQGTYCLTPAAGISSAAHPAVVSVEPAAPASAVALAAVDNSAAPAGCAPGDYKVVTYRIYIEAMGGPLPADDVPFAIVVA